MENRLGIMVNRLLSPDLPSIKTLPDMLTEAFRVVIKNAVEAIERKDQSGGELWVETCLSHGTIDICIRDNGLGIKSENMNRVFEMGWSTKDGKGMGFGLFWTKDYLEGLGGSIRFESVWQEGATFYIRIPVHKEAAA
jgi:two-component system nitrogen regulation sensor histidine kinase NtrY